MGIVAEFADIIDTITHSGTGSETRGTDINGIGTMVDGCDAIFKVLGRGK